MWFISTKSSKILQFHSFGTPAAYVIALEQLSKKIVFFFGGKLGIASKIHAKQEEIEKNAVFFAYSNQKYSCERIRLPKLVCGVIRR